MYFLFPYFSSKLIYFFYIRFFICSCVLPTKSLAECRLVNLKRHVFFVLLDPPHYFLSLTIFTNIFCFISSNCVFRLLYCCLLRSFILLGPCVFYFLKQFRFFFSFFMCPSNLNSHPAFVFLFGFLCRIFIIPLTSFAPE